MQNDNSKFKKEFISRLINFSIRVIKLCERCQQKKTLRPLLDQLIRSSTSVGANVVEAKSSSSKKDYIRFFEIALKSANETKYWLILLREVNPHFKKEIEALLNEAIEISNILASGILTMKGKK